MVYEGSFFPASPPAFVVYFLYDGQSDWGTSYFSIVLICISFIAKNAKHFPSYLLAIFISSSENCPFFCPFVNWIIYSFAV
jgi:hypothetical protein